MPNGRKLTSEELRRARLRVESSEESIHSIARRFGISDDNLRRQFGREVWSEIARARKANGWKGAGKGGEW